MRRSRRDAIRKAFLAEYERIFRKVPPVGEIEVINIRVALTAPVGRAALEVQRGKGAAKKALKGRRRGWLASREKLADMPVYDRYALPVGVRLKGPAIIEEASTTVIVPAGARAHVDRSGNLIVDWANERDACASPSTSAARSPTASRRSRRAAASGSRRR